MIVKIVNLKPVFIRLEQKSNPYILRLPFQFQFVESDQNKTVCLVDSHLLVLCRQAFIFLD